MKPGLIPILNQLMEERCKDEDATGTVDKASTSYRYDPVPLKEDNGESTEKPKCFRLYLGIIYAMLAAVCQLIANVSARRLSHYHTSELIVYRVSVEIVFLIPILIQQRIEFIFWSQAPLMFLMGAMMSGGFFFRIFTIQSLPLTESQAIMSSYPIVTAILGRIFMKYRFTNVKISSLVTNIIGLVLVCHFWTGLDLERYLGLGSGFLYLLFHASATIVLKKLTVDMPPKMVVFHVSWMRLVVMLSVTEITNNFSVPTIPECPDGYQWYQSELVLIFLMGIATLANLILQAEAVKLENPSTVNAVFISVQMPLAIVSQMMFFSTVPSVFVIVGMILVLMASLLINIDGIVDKLSPESPLRRLITRINNS